MPDGLSVLRGVIAARGLSVRVRADGRPYLKGDAAEVTPALREMMAIWRDELAAGVEPDPPEPAGPRLREWRWPSRIPHEGPVLFGPTVAEEGPGWCSVGDESQHPGGAAWWRWKGEPGWRPIPGRDAEYFRAHHRGASDWNPDEDRA